MELKDIIQEQAINLAMVGGSKEQVLSEMVDLLVTTGALQEKDAMLEALLEREGLGSTGIGYGVAIPHGRCHDLKQTVLALGRTQQEVDFDAIDGKPARLFFLLVAPEDGANDHLRLLAKIARLMKDAPTREEFLRAESPKALVRLIFERDSA